MDKFFELKTRVRSYLRLQIRSPSQERLNLNNSVWSAAP